jgi:hypothetical protein
MEQKPSVGRIVHYKAPANDEYEARIFATVITRIQDDEAVDLCVFGQAGFGFRQGVKKGDEQSQWNWPARV